MRSTDEPGATGPRSRADSDDVADVTERVLGLIASRNESQRVALAELELWAEQLERSNQDLSEFAYIAAHDLRAPLAALAGSAELLARRSGTELSEESQRHLAAILARVGTMARMIDGILAYCQAGNGGEDREVVDCTEVLAEALEHLAPEITDARARITTQPLGMVAGERTQLVRLFQNLLSNALKFRRPGCDLVIDVSVRRVGDDQVFSVADTGIGVSPDDRADMFRMFRRLDPQTASPGNGMGLAICKRIVERHGGSIWVDDTLSAGLCVSFSLPAAAPTS
ncbi:MAG: hypothetical protein KY452_06510 [Actinobacteria bacterium]|nr:hypothetical protein [Actinomycetota bacterium]